MPRRSNTPGRVLRGSVALLLILGLARAPIPQADYHNVRHHDGPNQVCELHDHLLRWHPDAGAADDVAILHWHWLPSAAGDEGPARLGQDGPKIRAHVDDWQGVPVDDAPRITADARVELLPPPALAQLLPYDAMPRGPRLGGSGLRAGPEPPRPSFGSTLTLHAPLACWLAHWSC